MNNKTKDSNLKQKLDSCFEHMSDWLINEYNNRCYDLDFITLRKEFTHRLLFRINSKDQMINNIDDPKIQKCLFSKYDVEKLKILHNENRISQYEQIDKIPYAKRISTKRINDLNTDWKDTTSAYKLRYIVAKHIKPIYGDEDLSYDPEFPKLKNPIVMRDIKLHESKDYIQFQYDSVVYTIQNPHASIAKIKLVDKSIAVLFLDDIRTTKSDKLSQFFVCALNYYGSRKLNNNLTETETVYDIFNKYSDICYPLQHDSEADKFVRENITKDLRTLISAKKIDASKDTIDFDNCVVDGFDVYNEIQLYAKEFNTLRTRCLWEYTE